MKICLDAGHYGNYNQGANKKYFESRAMWKLTNYQKQFLEEYAGVTVVLTRSNVEKDLSVYNRGMKSKGCDLFISNHSNSSDGRADFPVVIRAFDNKNNAEVLGLKLAKKVAQLMDTKQAGRTWTRKYNGGEYYGVLRGARAAGCPRYYIIEHSFHDNLKACNWLLSDSNLKKMAKAEVEIIADYYNLKKKSAPTAPFKQYQVEVITESLNIRKGAGTKHDIVGKAKKGEEFTVYKEVDGWGKISSKENKYISLGDKYVKKAKPKFKSYVVRVNTTSLNIRKGPGTSHDICGEVKKGDSFTIIEEKDGWGKLKSGAGWIKLSYTDKV